MASNGHINDAEMVINAVAEQYPELKSNENYKKHNHFCSASFQKIPCLSFIIPI